jgi:hypothetical protein
MAAIPTATRLREIASVGSSHNRLTSPEDNEEASLLALPGHRSFGQWSLERTEGKKRGLISPTLKVEALRPKSGKRRVSAPQAAAAPRSASVSSWQLQPLATSAQQVPQRIGMDASTSTHA